MFFELINSQLILQQEQELQELCLNDIKSKILTTKYQDEFNRLKNNQEYLASRSIAILSTLYDITQPHLTKAEVSWISKLGKILNQVEKFYIPEIEHVIPALT